MILEDVKESGMEGERLFYQFLRLAAKPDSRYVT